MSGGILGGGERHIANHGLTADVRLNIRDETAIIARRDGGSLPEYARYGYGLRRGDNSGGPLPVGAGLNDLSPLGPATFGQEPQADNQEPVKKSCCSVCLKATHKLFGAHRSKVLVRHVRLLLMLFARSVYSTKPF